MTISSLAARRRYFDRSSLTFARATARVGFAFALEPALRFGFRDDREDFNRCFRNVIEHPDVADSQPKLRTAYAAEPLDSTLADLRRLEPEVAFQSISNLAPIVCSKAAVGLHGRWGQDNLTPHSG